MQENTTEYKIVDETTGLTGGLFDDVELAHGTCRMLNKHRNRGSDKEWVVKNRKGEIVNEC